MNIPSIANNVASGTVPHGITESSSAGAPRATGHLGTIPSQTAEALPQVQKTEASRQELEDAVKAVNDFLAPMNNSLQFNLDDSTGKTIVKVIDSSTQEVIKQFPSEEMLAIAKAIDKMKGLLVQQKV